jgi:hypothetical protein
VVNTRLIAFAAYLVTVVTLGIYAPGVNAHPTLTFVVSSQMAPLKNQPGKPTGEAYLLVVVLGHQYLTVEIKGKRNVYDFAKNRLLVLDLQNNTYEDYSLFSDIGFRVLEFHNRLMLGSALRSERVPAPAMNIAAVENLFSLLDDKAGTEVTSGKVGRETVFQANKQELVRVSDTARALPAGYQTDYWRFIRYYAGGHPKVLATLGTIEGIPEKIMFVLSNLKLETRTLTLQTIETAPDAPYSLHGFTLAMPDREPFKMVQEVGLDAPTQLTLRVTAALKERDLAFAAGRYLDAMLANDEAMLSTGDGNREWLMGARDQLINDGPTKKLVGALSPHDGPSTKQAAEDLHDLRDAVRKYLDVIDIFEGNTLLALKQGPDGEKLLLSALILNPYITGAWHDLGDYYYRSFRMREAWACMDVARRIAPSDPMLQEINKLEQALRDRNPGFF